MDRADVVTTVGKLMPFLQAGGEMQEFSVINSTGKLLQAYDGYNGIQVSFSLADINGLIPGDIFYKLISSIKTKEINLGCKADTISVRTKSLIGSIKCLDDIAFPELDFNLVDVRKIPKNYKEALQVCRFAVSTDISLGCRTGIIFYKKYAFAIDRYNLMMVNLGTKIDDIYVMTPDFASKLIDHDLDSYCIKENDDGDEIVFSAGDTRLFGSLLKFDLTVSPLATIKKFRSKEFIEIGVFPESMKDALSRHEIMLGDLPELEKRIKLEFSSNVVTIRSISSRGKIIEKIKLENDLGKTKIAFQINPLLLKDILKYNPKVIIYQNPVMIEFVEQNFNYFVMGESDDE